ncbi:MAG TPA: STAS domain-containing protein [Tenericutes bacterium]|nr:STAS domain-containing protein [Mycoplasmatota bacterium]
MLDIDVEFRKGILFVRLFGVLDKNTVKKLEKEVLNLVKNIGIKNIVFNMQNLTSIDISGIKGIYSSYSFCKKNDGKSIMCGLKNPLVSHRIKNSRLSQYMFETSDEIGAINVINL